MPWAGVFDPDTGKFKKKIKPYATGLWTRYGNPIIAPDWFLDQLPACPLDGELWAGRRKYQLSQSITRGDTPDERFDQIAFAVYSSPSMAAIMATGEIRNSNMLLSMVMEKVERFVIKRLETFDKEFTSLPTGSTFDDELMFLRENIEMQGERCYLHRQIKLPAEEQQAKEFVEVFLNETLDKGGEGVVIRDPASSWTPKRHKGVLKYKPHDDDEGTIVGFTSGRETDKGSKLLGMIGALILDYKGKRLELSGLTDEERQFATPAMRDVAVSLPGKDMPSGFSGKHFEVGQSVTFKYRELSDDGIPKEARYWRKREAE